MKHPVYAITGLGLMFLLISGTQPPSTSGHSPRPDHGIRTKSDEDWAVVEGGSWQPELRAYGLVSDVREVRVSASFPVKVLRTDIELGQLVKRGQTLAVIEAPALSERITRLDGLRRHIVLLGKGVEDVRIRLGERITTNEELIRETAAYDLAKSEYDASWHQLEQQLVSLGQEPNRAVIENLLATESAESVADSLSKIICPIDGVVMERRALPGLMMGANALLYSIEDVGGIYIDVGVVPSEVSDWEGGAASADIFGSKLSLALIDSVPRFDPDTGLMLLRYRGVIPNKRQVDGAWIPVTVYGAEREAGWVPRGAVVARDGVVWCLVDDGSGKPKAVRVRVGEIVDNRIPIIEGVSSGERVLIHNAYEILYRDLNDLIQFQD